jgi:hypothetical protein
MPVDVTRHAPACAASERCVPPPLWRRPLW